jgi:hypothetical protein
MNLRQMLANANDPNFGKAKKNGGKSIHNSPNKTHLKGNTTKTSP